jgi:RHS repeat-associated protein
VWWWGTIGLSSFQFSPTFDILPEPRYLTGDGVTGTDHELPQRLTLFDGEPRVVQISGACGHFALLKADGTVWELGYVPRLSFHAPPQGVDPKSCGDYCYFSQDPVLVTNLPSNIASIAADTDYTLALTEDGKVYAWGEGRGLFHYQWYLNWPDPVRIEGFKDITKLSTSLYTVLALDKYGQVWGWGDNSWGQLGIDPGDDPALSAFTSPIPLQGIDYARDIVAAGWTAFGIATLQQNRVTGLRGTGLDKKIRLDWKPFPRASYYEVRRSATNSGVGDLIGTTGKNTFFDTGILGGNGEDGVGSLTTNVGHFYTVTALVDREATQPSVPIWVCPVPPPGIPLWPEANGSSSTGAVGTCRSIRLEWVAAVGASEYQVYRWTAPSNPPVFLGSTRDCTWFDRTIASGSTNWFYYTVRAVNEAGGNESAPSTWARLAGASCPPAPTITGFEIPYNGQARLSWTQSTGGVPITGYRVKWYFGSKIPTETTAFIRRDFLLDPMDPLLETNGLTYSFTWDNSFGLAADLIFWCKVSALDEGEEGNDSALVGPVLLCVSCSDFPPPMGLRAEPGDKQVFLDWTDDPDAASYELEYRVYNSTNSQWIPVTNHIVENRFWQEGLTNEVTYEHHVRSWRKIYVPGYTTNYGVVEVNSTNWSQSVTSTPSASLRATNISFTAQAEAYDGMVYIHWESLTNRPPLLCFLERKPAGAPDSAYSLLTTTDYGLAYLDRDVVNGSTYTYRVNALDNHWNRTRRSVDAAPHPTATSFTLLADPGNGHVRLAWNQPYGVNQFHVRCALEPGGPYENLVTLSDRNEYVHRGLPNGVRYYYIVRATTLYGAAFDSNEASTVPMETNAPLSPESLNLTLGDGEILISWPSSSGAAGYLVKRLDPNIEVYSGPANACRYPVPSGTTNGTFTFGVYAYSRVQAMSTPPRTNSINYEATQGGLTGQVLLSIGSVDISSNYAGLVVNGPTNLVLRASVKANEAAGAAVYFYDVCCQKVIGQGEAPDAQVTWSQVPQGVHTVQARVTSELWSATGIRPGAVYSSELGCVTNKMTPELVMYQTGSSDLQLPAPGLPIIVSRSYNSRTTNNIGRLGKGWSANWDQAKVELASTLSGGWAQAGRGEGLWINQFYITETASHLVTVTLPGGATAYFGAQLTVPEGEDPRYPDSRVRLGFMPYGPNQGQLSCAGSENPSRLNVLYSDQGGSSYDWTVGPLNLVGDVIPGFEGDAVPFVAMSFLYTAPDGTRYEFARAGADAQSWLLSEVTDRNGNSLAYQYEGASTILTNIVHSNGRKVGFSYSTNGTERSVSVYDSIGGAHPVIRYKVQDELLREVHKLVDRASGCYETNWYEYASPNRLTDIYDGRLIRVLHNEYGTNSEGVCDGRLVLQVDALNRTNAFNLDPNNVLTIGRVVNGTNETVTVGHEVSGAVSEVRGATTNHLAYDGQGRLVAQIDVDGNAKTIGYDSANRPVSQSDELSHVSTTRYNPFGDPLYVADANQNTNRFEYSQEGNLVTSIDPAGVHTAMEYGGLTNVVGQTTNIVGGLRLSESRDAAGVLFQTRTEYEYYSVFGQTVNLPGELKRQTEKWVDASGQPVSGHCIVTNSFEYDGNGNRTAEIKTRTLANGAIQTIRTDYTFDPQGRLRWSVVSASGGETLASQTNSVFYDAAGKQAATIDSANRTNSFTYDAGGNLIQTLYPDGTVSRTTYDEQNRVLYSQERVRPDGNGTTAPATLNLYDVYGRSVRVERRAGVVLTLQSAALGTHFQGKTGATALMLVVSNPGTVVSFTRTAYDYLGRVKYTVDARGAVTESGYDAAGRRTTNRVWTSYTVPTTNVNAAISPSGTNYIDTVFGYDANGNQVWVCDGSGRWTTNYYDGANRLTVVEFPRLAGEATSRIRRTEYDGLGRRILETDEAGVQNRYFYDFRGLLTAVSLDVEAGTNALNSYYKYDELGNQTEQKDSLNRVTKFQYDALGRRTRRTLPDGSFETAVYEFVPGGDNVKVLRISRTDFRTNTIVSTHDCMDRVRTKVLPAVNPGESETTLSYIYSSTNGLLDRVEMFGQVARTNYYQFDELRRLVKKDNPEGVLAYTYGASLSLESLKAYRRSAVGVNATIGGGTVPDVWLGYCYDALGRLASVTNCALAAPNVTSYRYDAVGNLDTCEYPNGVKHVYSYDERNRLRSLALTHSTGSLLRRFDYDLDPTGQRRAVSEVEGAGPSLRRRVAYEYDVDHSPVPASKLPRLHRLTQESLFDGQNNSIGTVARTYDRVGNRTSQDPQLSFSPDESIPTQSFAFDRLDLLDGDSDPDNGNDRYDANGNTLKDADGIATGDRYDAENRLIQRGAGISIGYDHEGNRAWKRVGAMTTYYLLDSLNPSGYVQVLAEYSSLSNAPARAYAYGHDLLSQVLTGTQAATNYYGYDGLGSVRLLLSSVQPESPLVTGTTPSGWRNNYSGWVGLRLQVGSSPLVVSALGRWVVSGNSGTHTIKLVRSDGTDVPGAAVSLNTAGAGAGQFQYGPLSQAVVLQTNTVYFLVSQEVSGGDSWYDNTTTVTPASGVSFTAAVYAANGTQTYQIVAVNNRSYGPVSLRFAAGPPAISDTYDYDAYGTLVDSTGSTPNHYRFTGEQWDQDLGMYSLRARYYNPQIGRFWTMDTYEGRNTEPLSLHKYFYCSGNPVNCSDPLGKGETLTTLLASTYVRAILAAAVLTVSIEGTYTVQNHLWGDKLDGKEQQKLQQARRELLNRKDRSPKDLSPYINTALSAKVKVSSNLRAGGAGAWGATSLYGQVAGGVIHLDKESFSLDNRLLALLLVHEAVHVSQWVPSNAYAEPAAYQAESDLLRGWDLTAASMADARLIFPGEKDYEFLDDLVDMFDTYHTKNPAIKR